MGRGTKAGRKRKAAAKVDYFTPTPELLSKGTFVSALMAQRRKPVIDVLFDAGQITEAEYSNLAYYREQAHRAEDDVASESVLAPAKIMGGGGQSSPVGGYIPSTLVWSPAIVETARIERELARNGLLQIAQAIAVEDKTLTQWCIAKHGGRERYDGKGKFVAMVPVGERECVKQARLELKYAAGCFSR